MGAGQPMPMRAPDSPSPRISPRMSPTSDHRDPQAWQILAGGMADAARIAAVVNAAAVAYRGVIPADCWHEPYMPLAALRAEIEAGVRFSLCESAGGELLGVMGLQPVREVTLIRHAYVMPASQRNGIGSALLARLLHDCATPVLVGTWAAAAWAIRFYQRHGFALVPEADKPAVLRRYWTVPDRQIDTSVVLADARWSGAAGGESGQAKASS